MVVLLYNQLAYAYIHTIGHQAAAYVRFSMGEQHGNMVVVVVYIHFFPSRQMSKTSVLR